MAVHLVHDAKVLKHLIPLAQSQDRFLSVYLPIDPGKTTTEDLRVRLRASLDNLDRTIEQKHGEDWLKAFRLERVRVEEHLAGVRPEGLSLLVFSSLEGDMLIAYWLPRPTPRLLVHYDQGASVLPLLDMLDEFEPVVLAQVSKDKARLLVFEAGIMESDERFTFSTPSYSRPGAALAKARGHGENALGAHLKSVVEMLGRRHDTYPFRRLFVAGSRQMTPVLTKSLSDPLQKTLAGTLSIDAHASDEAIKSEVLRAAEAVERQAEEAVAGMLVTRAEKNDLATTGLAATLAELAHGNVSMVVMTLDMLDAGRRCPHCGHLYAPETRDCPQDNARTEEADLLVELPRYALRRGAEIEVVHGAAAARLAPFQGIGALLRYRA